MTRNNQKSEPAPLPTAANIEDHLPGLPDLSLFRDDEKQHILNVLLRDENLRNQHLKRFVQLKQEVASLREKSQTKSSSMCARCLTPFGYIFNTGDTCPKCAAKVCKQCRLIYNLNDNTWLCQLCCKQMQLMSYSGEWIYLLQIFTNSTSHSPGGSHKSFQLFSSTQNLNAVSSSDSEPEDLLSKTHHHSRFNPQIVESSETRSNDPTARVMVQKKYDEQRLAYIKHRVEKRPKNASATQPLPRKAHRHPLSPDTRNSSSDEGNTSVNQSKNHLNRNLGKGKPSLLNSKDILKANSNQSLKTSRNEIDNKSIQSSQLITRVRKADKDKLKVPRRQQSLNRGSLLSLVSKTSEKSSSKSISASMQSLRNAVHRISHSKVLSGSPSSIHSAKEVKPDLLTSSTLNYEDAVSLQVPDIHSRSIEKLSPLTQSNMPSFYPSTRHRTLITKQLSNHDDDDSDSIYKETFIIEIFQHWKAKALEHQHSIDNPENLPAANHFTQALASEISSTETPTTQLVPCESTSNNNKNEPPNVIQSQTSTVAIKKRTSPLPTSNTRRKIPTEKNIIPCTEVVNPNLLGPSPKNKHGATNATVTAATTKKPLKASTIFIEPKKTQPSLPPRLFSSFPLDESNQTKRKATVEKQHSFDDAQIFHSTSPTWTPKSHITPTRSYAHSLYDDETSSDESNHESLLIRNKRYLKRTPSIQEKHTPFDASNLVIPSAIYIIDPDGNSQPFDLHDDAVEEYFRTGRIVEHDSVATSKYFSNLNSVPAYSSVLVIAKTPSVEEINSNRHVLHSIGEEVEEEELVNKFSRSGSILSRQLNRIEASVKSQKMKFNTRKTGTNSNQTENNPILLPRRWSDSVVSDEDDEYLRLPQRALPKPSSASSVTKQTVTSSPKLSIDSRTNLQTPQSSVDEPKPAATVSRQSSVNEFVLTSTTKQQSTPSLTNKDESHQVQSLKSTVKPQPKQSFTNTFEPQQKASLQSTTEPSRTSNFTNKMELQQTPRLKNSAELHQRTSLRGTAESPQTTNLTNTTEPSQTFSLTNNTDLQQRTSLRSTAEPPQTPDLINTARLQQTSSLTDTKDSIGKANNENRAASIENQITTADHDRADVRVEKKKLGLSKIKSSLTDLYTSQSSLNSAFGDTKSHYSLDISGTIELKLRYNMNKGALDVFIKKCTDLARVKRNQAPNPYCKLYLLPDNSKTSKQKTTVKKDTIEPEYDEVFYYQLNNEDFNSRILWISVWSHASLGSNYFLGEIHIPFNNCILDRFEEYTLLARMSKDSLPQTISQTDDSNELSFDLTFITNSMNIEIGTLQINAIQGKNVKYGKHSDIICKGVLMPGVIKRKLAISRKGPSPKWDIPLRWENLSRNNLKNISIEISLWRQERFRKTMMSFVRLTATHVQFDDKFSKSFDSTDAEKFAWDLFLQKPTQTHHIQLPLRPATN
ncbi:unnamed protein product [Rotaria socialis]|uniref:Uncharacterized protein n=1 Tax=Rotaria socialis TaxID=392032 RepID=A0A818X7H7_9BILA|nr:unnamed protein product [Rotaria socialis]